MTINMTSAAFILWSGMMVIAGAILILCSQVRHLVDLLESRRAEGPATVVVAASPDHSGSPRATARRIRNAGRRRDQAPAHRAGVRDEAVVSVD